METRPSHQRDLSRSSCQDGCEAAIANAAISEIESTLRPKIIDLISRQRLGYLTAGTQFAKYSHKGMSFTMDLVIRYPYISAVIKIGHRTKDKFWFCRLSANQEALCYGDCDGNQIPGTRDLNNKLPISEIKELAIGKDCPHLKEMRSRKSGCEYSFCLIPLADQDQALHFVMSDEKTFCYWVDGINVLLKREMSSKEAKADMETLLSMHMAIQLLETDGIPLPDLPPQVPPLPPNFDFALKY